MYFYKSPRQSTSSNLAMIIPTPVNVVKFGDVYPKPVNSFKLGDMYPVRCYHQSLEKAWYSAACCIPIIY